MDKRREELLEEEIGDKLDKARAPEKKDYVADVLNSRAILLLIIIVALYIIGRIYIFSPSIPPGSTPGEISMIRQENIEHLKVQIQKFMYVAIFAVLAYIFLGKKLSKDDSTFITLKEAQFIIKDFVEDMKLSRIRYFRYHSRIMIGDHTLREAISSRTGAPEPWYWDIGVTISDYRYNKDFYVFGVYCSDKKAGEIKHIKRLNAPFRGSDSPDVIRMSPNLWKIAKELREKDEKMVSKRL